MAFNLRVRAQARCASTRTWPFGLVFAVWAGFRRPSSISSREAGAAKRVPKKKHCVFSFVESNSYLVYRPERGRTTRRT
jgi:hypothetical protein